MNAIRKLLYPLALLPLLCLFACTRLPEYKVTEQGDIFTRIELAQRASIDDLHAIARKERPGGKGTVDVFFHLPAEYPGSGNPWAEVRFVRLSDTREQTLLTVYGAGTDAHRDSLLGVKPAAGEQALGKWHIRDPWQEAVLFITQKDSAYTLQRHFAGKYLETDHEPLPVSGVWADDRGVKDMKAPAFTADMAVRVPLTPTDAQTYTLREGNTLTRYRILPDGNLQLSDSTGHVVTLAAKVP